MMKHAVLLAAAALCLFGATVAADSQKPIERFLGDSDKVPLGSELNVDHGETTEAKSRLKGTLSEDLDADLTLFDDEKWGGGRRRRRFVHVHHRHSPHLHHRHRPHAHVPHVHVPHLHTAEMIKAAKDAAAKAAKDAKDAAVKAAKDAADAAAKAAKDAFDAGMKAAKDAALKLVNDKILPALIKEASWTPKQYQDWTMRIPKDFTGSQLDNSDDYAGYTKNADPVVQRVMKFAWGHMPHQDKCQVSQRSNGWLEKHPTPFADIAKMPQGPFSVYPFKAQYESDASGYFAQPCNAISNGFFLSMFKMPEMESKSACGNLASTGPDDPNEFAMDCLDEKHLLQITAAGMPFGSWYMHGDGGSSLGGFLDTRGMWVEFYFLYRMVLNNFVHDEALRAKLVMPGCQKETVPDESDGIRWVNEKGERMCHLYWARNFKKALTNKQLIKNSDDTKAVAAMLVGMPEMELSIAGVVLVTLRAVFHSKFPSGDEIYTKLTDKIIDTLMAKAPEEVRGAMKQFTESLDADKILGFENPHDGIGSVMDIFADFLDAMFWQESGKFGPGTEGVKAQSNPTAGCTWQPHSIWHRKATRVIAGFVKMGTTLKHKLKHPKDMTEFRMDGLKPAGMWVEIAGSIDDIVAAALTVFNQKRLNDAELRPSEGGKDILDVPTMYSRIKSTFGDGWPKTGNFVGDTWPKCPADGTIAPCTFTDKERKLVPTLCDTPTSSLPLPSASFKRGASSEDDATAPLAVAASMGTYRPCKNKTVSLAPCRDVFAQLAAKDTADSCSAECKDTLGDFVKTCLFETMPAKAQGKMMSVASGHCTGAATVKQEASTTKPATRQPEPSQPMPQQATAVYPEECEMNPCVPLCKKASKNTDDEGKPTTPHMVLHCAPEKECLTAQAKCLQSIQRAQKELGYRLSNALKDYTKNTTEVHQH